MRLLYKICFIMVDGGISMETALAAGARLGFDPLHDEEDENTYIFESDTVPSRMTKLCEEFIAAHSDIYAIDVTFRWHTELIPDRVVVWNGRVQDYTGHLIFTEDE